VQKEAQPLAVNNKPYPEYGRHGSIYKLQKEGFEVVPGFFSMLGKDLEIMF
jgi:hypothetical protein